MKIERKNDLSLRLLEIFGAVMRTQTTVVAAEELGMSQPAVSTAIRTLEKRLGFVLFERTNRGLTPTEEARLLFKEVEPVFLMMRGIERRIHGLRASEDGHLRVVATPPLGHTVIPVALKRFLKDRPGVRVDYDVRRLDTVVSSVEASQADVGLLLGLEQHPACEVIPLFDGLMECVLPAGHPLCDRDTITPADIEQHEFIGIGLDVDSRLGSLVRAAFTTSRIRHEPTIEVRYCHTASILADAGLGVAVVDPFTAQFVRTEGLVTRPFKPEISVSGAAVIRQGGTMSRLTTAFIDEVKGVLKSRAPAPASRRGT